jgi:hypothetical protein
MKLAGVVLLGAALRFFAIGFGIPYPQARPDETTVLGHMVAILAGEPNPHFFNWPSLTFYVLAGVIAAAQSLSSTLTPADYTLIARGCIALAGTATRRLIRASVPWRSPGTPWRTKYLARATAAVPCSIGKMPCSSRFPGFTASSGPGRTWRSIAGRSERAALACGSWTRQSSIRRSTLLNRQSVGLQSAICSLQSASVRAER